MTTVAIDPQAAAPLHPTAPEKRAWILLALMGGLYAVLAFSSLIEDSVTVDEFGHLPAGWNILKSGDFGYCDLNPPLMNVLSALPLLALDMAPLPMREHPQLDPGRNFWANGYAFMFQHAGHYHRLFIAARCVTVLLVGGLGVLVFVWAGRLAPERRWTAGLIAAAVTWFSPGMLAHARLATTDAGAACFTALAVFAFHALMVRLGDHMAAAAPRPCHPVRGHWRSCLGRVIGCGAALGLVQLVKFNAVLLYPAFLAAAIQWKASHRDASFRRIVGGLAAAFAISVVVIHAGYGFRGALPRLGDLALESTAGQWVNNVLPERTRLPLPHAFVVAFDKQLADAAEGDPSYLFGEAYEGGRWYYFLGLLAIKTPLPILLLAALAVIGAARPSRVRAGDSGVLLWPALMLFFVLSFLSNKQIGLRMLLPAAPLFWVWAAGNVARIEWGRFRNGVVGLLMLWLGVEVARIHPHYLAYFNPLVGGPSEGHRYALDSNLDWGQDLIRLREWLAARGEPSIQLLYFGRVDPAVYGLDYTVPWDAAEPGLVAVSVSLTGRTYTLNDHGKLLPTRTPVAIPAFFGEPIASIGHTIRVYRIGQTPQ